MEQKRKKILPTGEEYDVILTKQQLKDGITRIVGEIVTGYFDEKPPIILTVLNGGMQFGAAISSGLDDVDFIHEEDTIRISRYSDNGVGGEVHLISEPMIDLSDRNIIVVEDLVDKGDTLIYVDSYLKSKNIKKVEYCVIAEKKDHKPLSFKIKYKILGNAGPEWLIGFGMNYHGYYRGMQFVFKIKN